MKEGYKDFSQLGNFESLLDIKYGKKGTASRIEFEESHFSEMKQLLTKNAKVPTYIVPGDN